MNDMEIVMRFKSRVVVLLILLLFSSTKYAALVERDYLSPGDNLITADTSSGYEWLDLTETRGYSKLFIESELGDGGLFQGWRYATSNEVVELWSSFNIDLHSSASYTVVGDIDPNIIIATSYLGNIYVDSSINNSTVNSFPYGASGVTADSIFDEWSYEVLGAYYQVITGHADRNVYQIDNHTNISEHTAVDYIGSYLVRESSGFISLPSTIWLFGIGMGLIGVGFSRKRQK